MNDRHIRVLFHQAVIGRGYHDTMTHQKRTKKARAIRRHERQMWRIQLELEQAQTLQDVQCDWDLIYEEYECYTPEHWAYWVDDGYLRHLERHQQWDAYDQEIARAKEQALYHKKMHNTLTLHHRFGTRLGDLLRAA